MNVYVDRIYQDYYSDVGKYSLLSAMEEKALLVRYKHCPRCAIPVPQKIRILNCPQCGAKVHSGVCPACSKKFNPRVSPQICPKCGADRDLDARERLIVSNLRFVMKMAKKFTKNPVYIQRLVSAGNVGLVIAVDKFDLRRNTRFLTYAAWWIRKEMIDELHASGLVYVPPHKQKEHRKKAKQQAQKDLLFGTTIPLYESSQFEIPRAIDASSEHADTAGEPRVSPEVVFAMESLPIADYSNNTESRTIREDTSERLHDFLGRIPLRVRDRFILMQHYDVATPERQSEPRSLHELAALIGITPERVRQIKESTVQILREELKKADVCRLDDICV